MPDLEFGFRGTEITDQESHQLWDQEIMGLAEFDDFIEGWSPSRGGGNFRDGIPGLNWRILRDPDESVFEFLEKMRDCGQITSEFEYPAGHYRTSAG